VELVLPPGNLPAGEHVLAVGLADSVDVERRDDQRLHWVSVSPTPGVVVVASPGDWEARFLYATLRDVSDLPVEGFVELERGRWRRIQDLVATDEATVQRAVARADLVVLRGALHFRNAVRGRGVLVWGGGGSGDADAGDWYLSAAGGPVLGVLAGMGVDSLPPATALRSIVPGAGDWVGLAAQEARRGPARPALVGGQGARGSRFVEIGAEGLWRWAFRGGAAGEAYRALVAGLTDWLLAAPDTVRGVARPLRPVVPRGLPLVFARGPGSGDTSSVILRLQGASGGWARTDTLRWDGAGRAAIRLPPGVYRYSLEPGGSGLVAVERWSEEWFPRPVTLEETEPAPRAPPRPRGARDQPWLFGVLVAALSLEWYLRRRRGLR
jgi:hypothetical protein